MKKIFLALSILGFQAQAATPFGVGQRDFTFKDEPRIRTLVTHVWYPVEATAKMIQTSERGPFEPVMAAKDAPIVKAPSGGFPIVLLSHGSGGKAEKLFWFAQALVHNGAVVIGVDHQGTMTRDNSADGLVRVWERAKDLSFALDKVSESADFKPFLNLSKVAAAGHSIGATTVLLLAGGRFSYGKLSSPIPKCGTTDDPFYAKLCTQMKSIDFKSYKREIVEGDYSDPRVKAVVAFDPGYVRWFQVNSLQHLKARPHLFIADRLANTEEDDIMSKEFLKILSTKETEVVPDSIHMSFLSACKPKIPTDDQELKVLCADNDKKLAIQKSVSEKSLAFLHKSGAM